MRTRRTGGDLVAPKTHAHSLSEPSATPVANEDGDCVGARSESGHEEAESESCLRTNRSRSIFSCGKFRLVVHNRDNFDSRA
jgi:hypothetical protein